MPFLEIYARYKKYGAIQNVMFGVCPIQKMVPFKKILLQIMNGLHTNHFCSMGTIMKFVINMEGLDADLERI
jgi:hypothetical protein